jgi:hypothetical protein
MLPPSPLGVAAHLLPAQPMCHTKLILGCKGQKNIKVRKKGTGGIAFRLMDQAEVRILYSVLILTGCALCSCANYAKLIIT